MKVLYIGVYRDGTGWAQAAIDYILSLDAAGVDVVPRAIKLNAHQPTLPPRILELEAKSSAGCDICIQHLLPHQMQYNGRFRANLGLFVWETSHFKNSAWADRLNCLDGVIVPDEGTYAASLQSGLSENTNLHRIPHTTDITRFQRSYEPLDALKPFQEQGAFLFYFIGEMVRRKNLAALLKAFHTEFDPSENVELVIKGSLPGRSQPETLGHIQHVCSEIKRGLKLHGGREQYYKQEIIIPDRLSDLGMLRLHASCDCFVMPSYGEAWCIPAFDAMAMGKTPIVTGHGGFREYLSDASGWLLNSHEEPVFGVNDSFDDLYVGNESWRAVDIGHLRRCMREVYEQHELRTQKSLAGMERAYDFTHGAVGLQFQKVLDFYGAQT